MCFPLYNNLYPRYYESHKKYVNTSSLKTIINKLDFLKKAVIIQWNACKKDLLLFADKLIETIPNPRNAKEHYESFIVKKNEKISKTIRNNYLST